MYYIKVATRGGEHTATCSPEVEGEPPQRRHPIIVVEQPFRRRHSQEQPSHSGERPGDIPSRHENVS